MSFNGEVCFFLGEAEGAEAAGLSALESRKSASKVSSFVPALRFFYRGLRKVLRLLGPDQKMAAATKYLPVLAQALFLVLQ